MTIEEELNAIDALDSAISDSKGLIALLCDGMEGPQERNEPVPYEIGHLVDVLGILFDLCRKAEEASAVLNKAHEDRVKRP